MASRRKMCSSYCASEKRMSQWEELMRKFSQAHQEKCRLRPELVNIPRAYRSTKDFPTGSTYAGTWDILGMSGRGVYTFPNGVVYEGDFEDGMFHGKGLLRYEDGATLRGQFYKGVMIERKLTFAEGLEYEEEDWQYCKMPDRRYAVEYEHGLQPAGRSNITNTMPAREIPPGFYDAGDGFYNPDTKSVYDADDLTSILRSPGGLGHNWILENCRVAPDPIMGPRQHLYETWSEPQDKLPPVPKPAADIHSCLPPRAPSVFDDDYDMVDRPLFYSPSYYKCPPGPSEAPVRRRCSRRSSSRSSRRLSGAPKYERSESTQPCTHEKLENINENADVADDDRKPSGRMMFVAEDEKQNYDTMSARVDLRV